MKKIDKHGWWLLFIIFFILAGCYEGCAQTKDSVYNYIKQVGIKQPEIVYRQMLYETDRLKCTNCSLDQNNLFGFRYNHKYLEFETWQESVEYYQRWQMRKGYTDGDYYEFLTRIGYATDPNYINTLKKIK